MFAVQLEGGAQAFMTCNQTVERSLERAVIKLAAQQQRHRHVVGATGTRVEPVEEPQALLGKGQCQRRVTLDGFDTVGVGRLQAVDHFRQFGHGRVIEQLTQRHVAVQLLTHTGNQLRSQQRVTAEFEEAIMATHSFKAQQLLEYVRQGLFGGTLRRNVSSRGHGVQVRCRQCFLVDLAIERKRQGIQAHEHTRHHVLR